MVWLFRVLFGSSIINSRGCSFKSSLGFSDAIGEHPCPESHAFSRLARPPQNKMQAARPAWLADGAGGESMRCMVARGWCCSSLGLELASE